MANHVLDADRNKTWNINTSGDTWIVAEDVTITVKRSTAIMEDKESRHDNLIKLLGDLVIKSGNGLDMQGKNESVYIGAKSEIKLTVAGNAVAFSSSAWGASLENHGVITSTSNGVFFGTNAASSGGGDIVDVLVNAGKIIATSVAVSNMIDSLDITNTAQGLIKGSAGIQLANGALTLDNQGTIIGTGDYAIYGGFKDDKITNTGTIKGDIFLSVGDDSFTNKGGTVNGEITGDYGSDTYVVDRVLNLVEIENPGVDTVKSSVSWVLGDFFEDLVLTGKSAIDGTGNSEANSITGNGKANIIAGLEGDDTLAGKGGADTFVFTHGTGTDTIKDFADGSDKIDLSDYAEVSNFDEIASIEDSGGGAVITLLDGDTITLTGVAASKLDSTDFTFA